VIYDGAMRGRSFTGCIVALALVGCGGSTQGSNQPSDPALDPEENALIFEINHLRQDAGIPDVLITCTSLHKSASLHSDDMRDKGYLSDTAPDGSTVRTRGCDAGYAPGCADTIGMAELVASGLPKGADVAAQWAGSEDTKAVLLNATLVVVGAGRSLADDGSPTWTLDLGGADDPSCQ
jgi:uncharacterized protein YkwD